MVENRKSYGFLGISFINSFGLSLDMKVRIKKRGDSYWIALPKGDIKKRKLHVGDTVEIEILAKKELVDLRPLFGIHKFKRPIKEVMADIKECYHV